MRFPPLVFTGKEKDEETGYGYFGARYMNHELMTMWLSVDPMADKYPNISPYAYCTWNPILFIDPNGEEKIISFVINSSNQEYNEENRHIIDAANRYEENESVIHLWAHGSSNSIIYCNPNNKHSKISDAVQMHAFLSNNSAVFLENEEQGRTSILVLHSCETGKGADNIAKQLSEEMNLLVVAPTEAIHVLTYNDGKPNEYSIEYGVNRKIEGKTGIDAIGKRGGWNIFYKGVKVASFDGHSKPIFKNPEQIIKKYEQKYQEIIKSQQD